MKKRTPLYDCHAAIKGRMVPFAGYMLPVQYSTGIITEHKAVREKAGMFDVSHMGELFISGQDALANIQKILTRDISGLIPGQAAYSPICNEQGGVVDDVLVYLLRDGSYMLVVNAANREKDVEWIKKHLDGDVDFVDHSDNIGQIAIQGPESARILGFISSELPERYYTFSERNPILKTGKEALISRTGYTGEDGFEIYADNETIVEIWKALLEVGEEHGLLPCGLGARDTLRLEAAMPLYGNDMDETVLPYEAGIGFFVNENKDFIGKDALLAKKDVAARRIGLVILDRSIARHGAEVFYNGEKVGVVTSGTQSPTLGVPICMARVNINFAKHKHFTVTVRGKQINAEKVPLPFYKREK
jgi:aminomethyltransferase